MTNKFVARYQGEIVGKRSSLNRTYTHAIVTQRDEHVARDAAYNYVSTKYDRHRFDHATRVAAAPIGTEVLYDVIGGNRPFGVPVDAELQAVSRKEIEGGFDGYVARERARLIKNFERDLASGVFAIEVSQWSMSEANARKAVNQWNKPGWRTVLAIVPAERVGGNR